MKVKKKEQEYLGKG